MRRIGMIALGLVLFACGSDDGAGSSSTSGGGSGGNAGTGGSAAGGGGAGGAVGGSGGGAGRASAACPPGITADADVGQALPLAVDTSYTKPTGKSSVVPAGSDLQAAIDAAAPGDELRLAAGATFKGPFTLPKKSGDAVIVITSDTDLPPPGTRIDPSYAGKLAKIVVPANVGSALGTSPGAHHYRLVGLEISPEAGAYATNVIDLGSGSATEADLPHHIVVDRCFVHGDPDKGARRGVALNSGTAGIVDSWFADFKEQGADSQAIAGWSGTGPYAILNNHLEGAGENVMFGGADPSIPNAVPSDITVCRNHIVKPTAWKALSWSEKNLFELKNARRVLVAGNVLENNWADAQVGFAVVLTPRNQDGSAPWSTIEDLTFVLNVVRHTGSGINIAGEDDNHPSQQQQRVVIQNNLLDDVNRDAWGGDGRVFQMISPGKPSVKVKIDHNTATKVGNAFLVMGDSVAVGQEARFTNNLVAKGDYGAFGSGKGEGSGALSFFLPGAVFQANAIVGGTASSYPSGNFFPATLADVGFADLAGGKLGLAPTSTLKGKGSDGKDPGADFAALAQATEGVAP